MSDGGKELLQIAALVLPFWLIFLGSSPLWDKRLSRWALPGGVAAGVGLGLGLAILVTVL